MQFAIRDDDVCFYTNYRDLESLYKGVWDFCPVSFAVIPHAVQITYSEAAGYVQTEEGKDIDGNKDLVAFLRDGIRAKRFSILLHGYDHKYRTVNRRRLAEFEWKDYAAARADIQKGKDQLEQLFQTEIKVFVPPSNALSTGARRAIADCRLDVSSISRLRQLDQLFHWRGAASYLSMLYYKIRYSRHCPHVLDYGSFQELGAYSLDPGVRYESLVGDMAFCAQRKAPFVLLMHYWQAKEHEECRDVFNRLMDHVKGLNDIKPGPVDDIFRSVRAAK